MNKIIYVDMDNCLCDYTSSYLAYKENYPDIKFPQSIPGLFLGLEPIDDGLDTIRWLADQEYFDVYILSAPSYRNPHSYIEKRQWVEKHLGLRFVKRLILSPHKNLNKGDYLIDDNISGKGQEAFEGELVHFGSIQFPDWITVREYFQNLLDIMFE